MYGTVSSVENRRLGSELVADAAVGATTLFVDFVADFNEEGGTALLNGASFTYTTVDPDAETITLAAPLTVAGEADDFVEVADTSAEAVEWFALVSVDDGDTVSATIPTSLFAFFTPGTYDEPVKVLLETTDDGEYQVASQPQAEPTFDGSVVWNPRVRQDMNATTVPAGTWTTITSWNVTEAEGVASTGDAVAVAYPGTYSVQATCVWSLTTSGRRGIRLAINGVGGDPDFRSAETDGQTYNLISDLPRLAELDEVSVQVYQTSGASLAVSGGRLTMYRVSI